MPDARPRRRPRCRRRRRSTTRTRVGGAPCLTGKVHPHQPLAYAPPIERPAGGYAVDAARLVDAAHADAANLAAAVMAIVDRVARDGGPAIVAYHAWTAMGGRHQGLVLQRARLPGVPLAVTLPID